ncbi:hypothetical protein ABZV65_18240 [Streptomyces bauhiniae]
MGPRSERPDQDTDADRHSRPPQPRPGCRQLRRRRRGGRRKMVGGQEDMITDIALALDLAAAEPARLPGAERSLQATGLSL